MVRPYLPIQAVPSDCSTWPPVGRGALRSKIPLWSSPRNPPWKMFLPSASSIADAADALFALPVGLGMRVIIGEVVPGCAIGAVIFPHRAPGTFAEIRAPALPMGGPLAGCFQSTFFAGYRRSFACRDLVLCFLFIRLASHPYTLSPYTLTGLVLAQATHLVALRSSSSTKQLGQTSSSFTIPSPAT
jgi:hypothetical protein